MKKIIFRVEHKKNKNKKIKNKKIYAGPYGRSGVVSSYDWAEEDHENSELRPIPDEDQVLLKNLQKAGFEHNWRDQLICGFTTLEQLKLWFTNSELNTLQKLGFVIVQYYCDIIIEGRTQSLFKPIISKRRKFIKF